MTSLDLAGLVLVAGRALDLDPGVARAHAIAASAQIALGEARHAVAARAAEFAA